MCCMTVKQGRKSGLVGSRIIYLCHEKRTNQQRCDGLASVIIKRKHSLKNWSGLSPPFLAHVWLSWVWPCILRWVETSYSEHVVVYSVVAVVW